MFIFSLPSPISCKCLSEGHTLKCTCLYKAVHSAAPGHLPAERKVGDMHSGWICLSPLTVLSQNGANSGKSKSLLSCLNVSTHTGTDICTIAKNALQAFVLIFQDTLGMLDVLACLLLGSSSDNVFSRLLSGATPLHLCCSKAGVIIFTAGAEKSSKVVERDVGEMHELNPLASQDRCLYRISKAHSI